MRMKQTYDLYSTLIKNLERDKEQLTRIIEYIEDCTKTNHLMSEENVQIMTTISTSINCAQEKIDLGIKHFNDQFNEFLKLDEKDTFEKLKNEISNEIALNQFYKCMKNNINYIIKLTPVEFSKVKLYNIYYLIDNCDYKINRAFLTLDEIAAFLFYSDAELKATEKLIYESIMNYRGYNFGEDCSHSHYRLVPLDCYQYLNVSYFEKEAFGGAKNLKILFFEKDLVCYRTIKKSVSLEQAALFVKSLENK